MRTNKVEPTFGRYEIRVMTDGFDRFYVTGWDLSDADYPLLVDSVLESLLGAGIERVREALEVHADVVTKSIAEEAHDPKQPGDRLARVERSISVLNTSIQRIDDRLDSITTGRARQ